MYCCYGCKRARKCGTRSVLGAKRKQSLTTKAASPYHLSAASVQTRQSVIIGRSSNAGRLASSCGLLEQDGYPRRLREPRSALGNAGGLKGPYDSYDPPWNPPPASVTDSTLGVLYFGREIHLRRCSVLFSAFAFVLCFCCLDFSVFL